jgi:hypothetical protein
VTDTPGIRAAEAAGLAFEVMRTERPSSAEESAALQGIELGQLLRTIVIRRGADDYVFVLISSSGRTCSGSGFTARCSSWAVSPPWRGWRFACERRASLYSWPGFPASHCWLSTQS